MKKLSAILLALILMLELPASSVLSEEVEELELVSEEAAEVREELPAQAEALSVTIRVARVLEDAVLLCAETDADAGLQLWWQYLDPVSADEKDVSLRESLWTDAGMGTEYAATTEETRLWRAVAVTETECAISNELLVEAVAAPETTAEPSTAADGNGEQPEAAAPTAEPIPVLAAPEEIEPEPLPEEALEEIEPEQTPEETELELLPEEEPETELLEPQPRDAYAGTCGSNLYWQFDPATGALLIGGYGDMWDYDDEPWDRDYFIYYDLVTSVLIEDGVGSIGDHAFIDFERMTEVSIPSTVQSIGEAAFLDCFNLKSVAIPAGVKHIGASAFEGCTGLKSLSIPKGVERIGAYAFMGCEYLKSITLPSGLGSIGEGAFESCSALTSLTIPSGVSIVPAGLCTGCESLKQVVLPDGITSIGEDAFLFCPSLSSINIPDGVTAIGSYAFWQNDTLKKLILPSSVRAIGDMAMGYTSDETGRLMHVEGFTVYGRAGGAAETYAGAHAIPFTAIELKLSSSALTLDPAQKTTLKATLTPAGIGSAAIDWSSDDESVATVEAGVVRAVQRGTATITACLRSDRTLIASCDVTVTNAPISIALTCEPTESMLIGEAQTLYYTLEPFDAETTVSWSSSSSSTVAVDRTGSILAKAEGTATITATTHNGKKASVRVTVVDPYKPTAVTITPGTTQTLEMESTLQLSTTLAPETAIADIGWKSSSTAVARVSADGLVTPVSEGTATITATAVYGKVKKTATVKVTVVDPYKPTALVLQPGVAQTLALGDTLELTATPEPADALGSITWRSSSTRVATVSAGGVVTPLAEGTVTITATVTRGRVTKTASVKVTVVDPFKPTAIVTEPAGTQYLDLDKTLQLSATLQPETAQGTVTWKSASTKIALVSAFGLVRPVSEGTTTITATVTYGSVKRTATVKVIVVDPLKPRAIVLEQAGTQYLDKDKTLRLDATVEPETALGTVSFRSSSAKIATVDENGLVTPVSEGTATITATVTYQKVTKSTSVKVTVVDPLKPRAVTVEPAGTLMLAKGATQALTPIVTPSTAIADITWRSNKPKLVTVTEDGVLCGLSEGTATITVTATYGSIRRTAAVKVTVYDPRKPQSVALDVTGAQTLRVGESLQLTATQAPATAQGTITWKSSAPKYAKVDATGRVTAVSAGKATITATATFGGTSKSVSVKVTVVK